MQGRTETKDLDLQLTEMKRNPYLADYSTSRRRGGEAAAAARPASRPMATGAAAARSASRPMATGTTVSRPTSRLRMSPPPVPESDRRAENGGRRLSTSARARRRKAHRQRMMLMSMTSLGIAIIVILTVSLGMRGNTRAAEDVGAWVEKPFGSLTREKEIQGIDISLFERHPEWTEDFLTVNEYSRPGDSLTQVNSIFVHYTANPGTSAVQNRSYFESLKDTHERSASAHFIINYDGKILQCIPLDEIAYAVRTRNEDSISIECCYLENDGTFTQETYDSLLVLLKWLTEVYDLETEDILRHYDCGGKQCPLYYTEHPDAWERLKRDVKSL